MKTIKKEKTFDCVKMKNDIQAQIYAETKGMNTAELLAYFNQRSENSLFGKSSSRTFP
jgi:hypothetical protein